MNDRALPAHPAHGEAQLDKGIRVFAIVETVEELWVMFLKEVQVSGRQQNALV